MGPSWKQDKYILALTASNPESNAAIEIEIQQNLDPTEEEIPEEDLAFYQLHKTNDANSTKILSNLWHPYRHFMAQLKSLKNTRKHSKIKRTLLDVLQVLNHKRFLTGADNRLQGI